MEAKLKENKEIKQLISHIANFMKCPNCGASYDVENVQYLGKIQVFYVVQLFCQRCSIPVFASVLIKESRIPSARFKKEKIKKDAKPISSDDLIDFHNFISKYEGDFKTLLS